LQEVIAAARKGQIRAVIVSRLDRFGRSSLDLLANIKAVTDAGAEFIAVEQGLHVRPRGDAMSQLLLTILAAVAEFEREIIRDRVIEGQRRAKERGVILGGPRKNIDADAVRALRAEGKSWKAIAKELGSSTATVRRRAGVL
jgi:DNA invertase Pin-like site-specific DNA recombinase